eukprot:TRINITY_DN4572_c0_g1_i1.p1 TRINITY_DN4572_c0_g1~~TRINITY_DN4572_c0_g1_i1.p1  ORF type:complete len:853 (+),score=190.70 TRINITY_DN4572_c0_g1_i1:149-2560(+)
MYLQNLVLVVGLSVVSARCPFAGLSLGSTDLPLGHVPISNQMLRGGVVSSTDAQQLNFTALAQDLEAFFLDSQTWWPADYKYYGPFFVRLAWHCSGSYRTSDGRGGCEGGHIRFDPQRSWADNTNLDKAIRLLSPIKEKYGASLSWGDLITFAGTTAIKVMGGPVLGFCAGRQDDDANANGITQALGPTPEQAAIAPCAINGTCKMPLGTSTVGLIYVNPEGPLASGDPAGSAVSIRDVFARMAMNDSETVALIGGGHAFGKSHGACRAKNGPPPSENPAYGWRGGCNASGEHGVGRDTVTSGIEGPWTVDPTKWDNEYFRQLVHFNWAIHAGPGGHLQWYPVNLTAAGVAARANLTSLQAAGVMMMTTDIALLHDAAYAKLVRTFAADLAALEHAFKHAWYKLVTRDVGPYDRCVGPDVPPPQPWQHALPRPPHRPPSPTVIRQAIEDKLLQGDGAAENVALLSHLAYQCASTFRVTDHQGGCDGARIRFPPESTWRANTGTETVLRLLRLVKDTLPDSVTWADLITLAGTVAAERAANTAQAQADASSEDVTIPFCAGRSDAADGAASAFLEPREVYPHVLWLSKERRMLLDLTDAEFVALSARPRSATVQRLLGYSGSWGGNPGVASVAYFHTLLGHQWQLRNLTGRAPAKGEPFGGFEDGDGVGSVYGEYFAADADDIVMMPADLALLWEPSTRAVVEDFAADAALFAQVFASAWAKMMNAGRYEGPVSNPCDQPGRSVPTAPGSFRRPVQVTLPIYYLYATILFDVVVALVCIVVCVRRGCARKKRPWQELGQPLGFE